MVLLTFVSPAARLAGAPARVVLACALALAGFGCAPRSAPARGHPNSAPSALPHGHPALRLVRAPVFDARGESVACELPRRDCAKAREDPAFVENCRLAGFQTRRCGCATYCAGRVPAAPVHHDEAGRRVACEPPMSDCTPPETSARFQDACEAAHHKLVLCGCAWVCTGPFDAGPAPNPGAASP
jgi:hypothetical protein